MPRLAALWIVWTLIGIAPASAHQMRIVGPGSALLPIVPAKEQGKSKPSSVVRRGEVQGITCEVTYDWPDTLSQGYFPLRINLANTTDRSINVKLEAEPSWGSDDLVRRRLALEPGALVEFEMLLRARTQGTNQYILTVEANGGDESIAGCGPSEYAAAGTRSVMVVTRLVAPAGTQESRSESWNDLIRPISATHRTDQLATYSRTFDQLSSNWQTYTSLDSVILELSDGLPEPDKLAALAAWCRAGGKLIVIGRAVDDLAQINAFAVNMESRFEWRSVAKGSFRDARLVAYHFGFGVLIAQLSEAPGNSALVAFDSHGPAALFADQTKFMAAWNRPGLNKMSRQTWTQSLLEVFDDLPLRSLMVLLVLFALVMGPVNFIWLKKTKRPMLLLVTVPGIALVTSVAMLLYGILSQGLDIKSITTSWAVLDQRVQMATTSEVREVFAGSAPGEGMRPEPGTAVFPEERYWRGSFRQRHQLISDQTDGALLSGDYFPVRQPFSQLLLSDRATRLRLEVNEARGQIEVSNMLGAGIQQLLLRAPNGEYHYLENGLEEGARAKLKPGGRAVKSAQWKDDLNIIWGGGSSASLVPGTYVAQLTQGSLGDDCGVEVNEITGRHVVLGILDVGEGGLK